MEQKLTENLLSKILHLAMFAKRVLEMYFGLVKWKQVAFALRGV
jgi:hypothetical protein